MRVIKSGETEHTCHNCSSVIGVYPHEIRTVARDYDDPDDNAGRKYWDCPVCKSRNYTTSSPNKFYDDSDFY